MKTNYKYAVQEEAILTTDTLLQDFRGGFFVRERGLPYLTEKSFGMGEGEEYVRAQYLIALVEKYGYPLGRIILDMDLPLEDTVRFPNIVVFKDNEKREPYILVECKPGNMSGEKRNEEKERTLKNARLLGIAYAIPIFGIEMTVIRKNGRDGKDIPPNKPA